MCKWKEIRNDYFDEEDNIICIDGWITSSDNEEGWVLAKVNCDTKEVVYFDEDAKTDSYAQEVIQETIKQIEESQNLK